MVKRTAYQQVQAARRTDKMQLTALITGLTSTWFELHGDRERGDDPAVVAGLGRLADGPVVIVGIRKGANLTENQARHFGCATPIGYRKVRRAYQLAAQLKWPVLALINTPGAYPGVTAEYQGQGRALADCLTTGLALPVPMVSVLVGEGGSGGALALACGDQVWASADSTYSVLSPEGYASILWKDAKRAPAAAKKMQLTPQDLKATGIVERIIPEPQTQQDCQDLATELNTCFQQLQQLSTEERLARREARYAQFK
ncbi:carboxyl transferase domain-containing protein [Lactiplantibacillus modestisalitolerans]|uniref:acetyl-CoA carboxytransferase n=1 Tax=Lactiplantibacillus modestisalitolerans TaxID=1457219 RepID=A0ABV5WYD7_9LACO|nr:carboxyl transferase domain-containing protein [Lactiplantibacillus modestisalitolerans]